MSALEAIVDPVGRDVLERYFAHINAGEIDPLLALFAEDARIEPSSGGVRQGRAAIGSYYRRTLESFAEHHDEPTRVHEAASATVVELRFTGRSREGAAVRFDAIDVFELDAGAIVRIGLWADTADIARQLRAGRVPADG